mgnify:CR=1 FL=1
MHLTELLHKTLKEELPYVHKKRLENVTAACEATIGSNRPPSGILVKKGHVQISIF